MALTTPTVRSRKINETTKSNKSNAIRCGTGRQNVFLLYCAFLLVFIASMNIYAMFQSSLRSDHDYGDGDLSIFSHPQEKYKETSRRMTKSRIEKLKGPDGPKYAVMVTGAAGFIGMHTAVELKRMGMTPIGYDNVNKYYSVELKESSWLSLTNE